MGRAHFARRVGSIGFGALLAASFVQAAEVEALAEVARIGAGWHGEIVATVAQSYAGWDVEIGDADNDGQNEILTTGCPDSRLYLFKKTEAGWQTRLLAEDLAQTRPKPGMGLAVKVVDLNGDGRNEVVLGTGQEGSGTAIFEKMMCVADADNDGANELVVSTRGDDLSEQITSRHLGHVFSYKVKSAAAIERELIVDFHDAKAESSWLAVGDADNDGQNEIVLATGKGDRTRSGVSYVVVVERSRPVPVQ